MEGLWGGVPMALAMEDQRHLYACTDHLFKCKQCIGAKTNDKLCPAGRPLYDAMVESHRKMYGW